MAAVSNSPDIERLVGLIAQSISLLHAQRGDEALRCLDEALCIFPDFPPALVKRGIVLQALSRHSESIADFDRCLMLKPDLSHVRELRDASLRAALERLDLNLASGSEQVRTLFERGELLLRMQRDAEALASYRQALECDPRHVGALNQMGNLLLRLNRHDDALACYECILSYMPNDVIGLFNRGNVLQQEARYHDALSSYATALVGKPDFPEILIEQAHCRLAMGEFQTGWLLFEARWKTEQLRGAKLKTNAPMWRGETLDGSAGLLLWAEQGLGDTIQFIRYLPLVLQRVEKVVVRAPANLRELIAIIGNGISFDVVDNDEQLIPHDMHCPLMSLPLIFNTTLDSIPGDIPYLKAPDAKAALWHSKLGARSSKPRIGLVWSGGQRLLNNPTRDMRLEQLRPLLEYEAEWISLQKSISDADLRVLETMPPIRCMGDALVDFTDTAGLIEQLDLIISVDSAVAHLAGALGKPVWLMLRKSGEWRWMQGRGESPWYPSHRIFRQQTHGEWTHVVQELVQNLSRLA
jgi:tetratricopeptide (TPR) repeat protein